MGYGREWQRRARRDAEDDEPRVDRDSDVGIGGGRPAEGGGGPAVGTQEDRGHASRPEDESGIGGPAEEDDPAVETADPRYVCPEGDREDGGDLFRYRPAVAVAATSSSSSLTSSSSSTRRHHRRRHVAKSTSVSSDVADFVDTLKDRGLEMTEVEGDGNCLFRAISLQVYGDESMHGEVRRRCLDFMVRLLRGTFFVPISTTTGPSIPLHQHRFSASMMWLENWNL